MAKLGDAHVVWDLTDPGISLAKARDALASYLRALPILPRGELRRWLGNALANRTLVCKKWRVYETRPETAERELKLYRFVVELRQQPVTRELCDRISSIVRGSEREERRNGKTIVYIEYFGHRMDFELKLTIGRLMRVQDAIAYAAYHIGFGIKSAYNTFSAYRACHGRPPRKADLSNVESLRGLSPAERDLVLQLTAPSPSKPAPWLPALVDHINGGGEVTQNGLLSVFVRALSKDKSLPFYIDLRRGRGHPSDRSLIQRNLDIYYRVLELIQLVLTRELCARLKRDALSSSSNEKTVRGATTITLNHPKWDRQLNLRLGKPMALDDAIQYAAHEHGLKFRPARRIFLDYHKALHIE